MGVLYRTEHDFKDRVDNIQGPGTARDRSPLLHFRRNLAPLRYFTIKFPGKSGDEIGNENEEEQNFLPEAEWLRRYIF